MTLGEDGNSYTAWIEVPCQLLVCFPQKTRETELKVNVVSGNYSRTQARFIKHKMKPMSNPKFQNPESFTRRHAQIPKRFRIQII